MERLNSLITVANDILWGYILIIVLLGCALYFTFKTCGVQFRMLPEMIRTLSESAGKTTKKGKKHISPFQAFTVSLASRVGTGNLAGVATAIAIGGPGAVFWMWIIALLGASSAFIESTLAQLYKRKSQDSFIGGPAYYMESGLGKRWMGVLFAILICLTFGLAFNSVQSNTICAAWESAFGVNHVMLGVLLTILTLIIIMGGIQSIARISSALVPIMAIGYIIIALIVVILNISELPSVLKLIFSSAFGMKQAVAGGLGAALMQGIKRGLFSNEAGMGSAPNAAASATTSHPVKQGLIQTLGVFTDTLIVCSCTAFIILFSGVPTDGSVNGVQLTQMALTSEIGAAGSSIVAIVILLLAFSSIIGNCYYGEANIRFITSRKWILQLFRICCGAMVMFGGVASLEMVWNLADVTMAMMTLCNLCAIIPLSRQAFRLLDDYRSQKKRGIKEPVFSADRVPDIQDKVECW